MPAWPKRRRREGGFVGDAVQMAAHEVARSPLDERAPMSGHGSKRSGQRVGNLQPFGRSRMSGTEPGMWSTAPHAVRPPAARSEQPARVWMHRVVEDFLTARALEFFRRTSPRRDRTSQRQPRDYALSEESRRLSAALSARASGQICAWIVTSSAVVGSSASSSLVPRQRHRDHDPLPLTAGKLVRVLLHPGRAVRDADELQHLETAVEGFLLRDRLVLQVNSINWKPMVKTGSARSWAPERSC